MGYIQEEHGSIVVEVVDLMKATLLDAAEFQEILNQDIKAGRKEIIIDISECEFIDSTFLGAIVISLKRISELGGKMCLVGVQPEVASMFKLTKMNQVFEIFETREDALESFM